MAMGFCNWYSYLKATEVSTATSMLLDVWFSYLIATAGCLVQLG